MSNVTTESHEWQTCLDGRADAFGALFDRHRARVYRHACRYAETREDAEDLLAMAFLELWRSRAKVRVTEGSVLPWLLVTTTNLALNQRRGQRRYRDFLARLPREHAEPDSADIALQAFDLDVDPQLVQTIRGLRASEQQLVVLVALEGYSLREAGQALGLSEAAARSRWQRIRHEIATRHPLHTLQLATTTGETR